MAKAGKQVVWTSPQDPCQGGQCTGFVSNRSFDQVRVVWVKSCKAHPLPKDAETVWNSDISDSSLMSEVA